MDGALAITRLAIRFLGQTRAQPFFLWLHYVNPHAPYSPPPPNDSIFLDQESSEGPHLRVVSGYHGGIPRPLFVSGHRNLAYYVAQYDGEVRTVDEQIGAVLKALEGPLLKETAVAFTSDHGESLGDHDYYFDHGEDLFDPCLRIPLILRLPRSQAGLRNARLSSTLDLLPTLVGLGGGSSPPGLLGESLQGVVEGRVRAKGGRLFGQNDRGLSATWDDRFKLVETPGPGSSPPLEAFYDRRTDPQETKDVSKTHPEELSQARRQLDYFLARENQDRVALRRLVASAPGQPKLDRSACERLKALGYVQDCSS
jgi:arylsulfatase A-like enzyme